MSDQLADERKLVDSLVGDQADAWDLAGQLPGEVLRELGTRGLLCAQVPTTHGGPGFGSLVNGELTAYVGSLCSSLRSVMTSQGMAAWTVQRLGDAHQRRTYLPRLASGSLAAVGFSEPNAGSDLSAMSTEIRVDGDSVVVDGQKMWVTAAHYADLLVIFGRYDDGAAGHANVRLDSVRLPAATVLGGTAQSLPMLVTTALAYGRMSVAWGCVGILRACLNATARHARTREQFGKPLAEHQLVARHLAELLVAEQVATRTCEHASRCWDAGSPDMVVATVLAKQVSAGNAARASATAVQVLASSGARDGHVVARAYRDAKLMEIIEGSTEICQLMLARHALSQ